MGRREPKERERKRAAASCQSLEQFLPSKKKPTVGTDGTASSESPGDAPSPSSPVSSVTHDASPELQVLSSTSIIAPISLGCSIELQPGNEQ